MTQYVEITVGTSAPREIQVGTTPPPPNVEVTVDPSSYYVNLAKEWATKMSDKVANEDYSSKYYAENARISAETAKIEASVVNGLVSELQENFNNFNFTLNETADNAIIEINANRDYAITQVNTTSTEAVSIVEQTASKAVSDVNITTGNAIEEIDNKAENLLDTDLSNITEAGLAVLQQNGGSGLDGRITNCITEIPQDIKLELKDGTLTLKAGSKVYVPNGFEADGTTPAFSEVIINSDKSLKQNFDTNGMFVIVYIKPNGTQLLGTGYKGSTLTNQPTPVGDYKVHYITSENKIFWDAPGEENCSFSLPIAIVNRSAAVGYTSIEQTFNGFGYIGSTVFALPNVKGLCPNGRNADGTLNNIEARTENVVIYTNTNGANKWYSFKTPVNGVWNVIDFMTVTDLNNGNWKYDEEKNTWSWKNGSPAPWLNFAYTTGETTSPYKITSLESKLPFRAMDYSEFSSTPHIVETYQNGTSGYIVYSNGYCEQWGITPTGGNSYQTMNLLKAYKDTNYSILMSGRTNKGNTASGEWNQSCSLPLSTTQFAYYRIAWASNWKAYGYTV